jgi:plastocyanin
MPGSGPTGVGPVGKVSPVKSPTVPPPVAPTHVEVTAEDSEAFRFVLSRPKVPAGKTIIEFVNHGQDEHNLNAIDETDESVAGSLPNTAPNGHLSLTVDLQPGSYTLFCSLPGHEAKGMKATLVVE